MTQLASYKSRVRLKSLALAVTAIAALGAASVQAAETNPHPWRHGVVPTRQNAEASRAWRNSLAPQSDTNKTLYYGGGTAGVGVMSGQSRVYLVVYGSQWGTQGTDSAGNLTFSGDTAGAAVAAQKMFKGIGTNGELWSAELTQWCEGIPAHSASCPSTATAFVPYQQNVFAGIWYDNSVASPASATAAQLAAEANKAAGHFGNTTSASNRYAYYVILSPKGTNPDNYQSPTDGYCAWHDYTTGSNGAMAYSNQPYNIDAGTNCGVNFVNAGTAGKLDGYTMTMGHEWHEMVSDQFPSSDSNGFPLGGWTDGVQYIAGQQGPAENSDECAWIAAGAVGGAANVAFSTGTFAQQASWSNDTNSCAISHAIVVHGHAPTANFSVVTTGLTASFSDSSSDSDGTIVSRAWNFGDGSTSTATSPSHTYASAGTRNVQLTVTDNSGLTASKTVSVTVGTSNVLTNGVPVTGLSAAKDASVNYTMAVPAGATNLKFTIAGGTGDADLYVKFGAAPTTGTSGYDCRPYASGNNESCPIATAQAGTYYVMVRAFAAYSGVTLTGSYTMGGLVFTNNTPVTIADLSTATSTIAVSGVTGAAPATLKVPVNISHTYIGDLKIDLIAPNGITFNLWNRTGAGTQNINQTFTVNAASVTAPNGTWTLRVADQAGGDSGTLNSWGLQF